ncbi:transcriptional regulator [Pseudoalteromonas ruthenica]|uniref:CAF17-like 4Fe-4S cluster assembly/insertion protein YgfZ n=1 Tax=Pseudoalteromonas ruthenica TaxID=151081 RepID=UPI0011088497|nr:folate-binding protein YgfZ [Pseudoalteromonas ruthenica]TLX52675.1 transcriptional regulator [Pseudoalteromonas ruthenica]
MSAFTVYATDYVAIYVSGVDAKSYLQGQLTQDINLVEPNTWLWAGQCSAKGKLWACFRIAAYQQGYLLICSADEAEAALRELKKYAVFSQVEITSMTQQVCGVLGDKQALGAHLGVNLDNPATNLPEGLVLTLADDRYLVVADADTLTPAHSSEAFLCAQIKAAEPSLCAAAIDEYVPQMVNLHALGGISFSKGCYTGQETVARMKYLGKNKRAMFVLSAQADSKLAPPLTEGQVQPVDLERQVGDNWRRGGTLIAQAVDQGRLYGLAVLPNDLELDSQLRAKHAPEVMFSIEPLPYSLTEE